MQSQRSPVGYNAPKIAKIVLSILLLISGFSFVSASGNRQLFSDKKFSAIRVARTVRDINHTLPYKLDMLHGITRPALRSIPTDLASGITALDRMPELAFALPETPFFFRPYPTLVQDIYCTVMTKASLLAVRECGVPEGMSFTMFVPEKKDVTISSAVVREIGVVGTNVRLVGGFVPANHVPHVLASVTFSSSSLAFFKNTPTIQIPRLVQAGVFPRLSALFATRYLPFAFGANTASAEETLSNPKTPLPFLDRLSLSVYCSLASLSVSLDTSRCDYNFIAEGDSFQRTDEVSIATKTPSVTNEIVATGVPLAVPAKATSTTDSLGEAFSKSSSQVVYLTKYITEHISIPGPAGRDGRDGSNGRDGRDGTNSSTVNSMGIPSGFGSYAIQSYTSPATSIGISTIGYLKDVVIDLPTINAGTANNLSLLSPTLRNAIFNGSSIFTGSASFTGSTTISSLVAESSVLANTILANSTTTNAYVASLTVDNATSTDSYVTRLVAESSSLTNVLVANSTTTNAYVDSLTVGTSTAGSLTLNGGLTVRGVSTLATTTIADLTVTNATSSTLFSDLIASLRGLFTDLVVTNSTTTNAFIQNLSIGSSTAGNAMFTNATTTNLFATSSVLVNATTTTLFTQNLSVGNADIQGNQSIDGMFNVTGTSTLGSDVFLNGNVVVGSSTNEMFTVNALVNSNFVPASNIMYDIGSPSFYWRNVYADNINVNTLSAASSTISGTSNNEFTINSDNGSSDVQDSSLVFFRGLVTPNALLRWNSLAKRLESNMSFKVQNETPSTGTTTLTVQSGAGQAATNLFEFLNYAGGRMSVFNANGWLGLGTSTPGSMLTVTGESSLATTTITGTLTVNGSTNITRGGILTVGDKVIAPGEIGAGTSSPSGKIAIQNTLADQVAFLIYGTSTQTAPLIDVYDYPGSNQNIFRLMQTGVLSVASKIGIGTTSPATSLHIATTDGIIVPAGTTAERPSTLLPGVIRYNTSNTTFEGFNGSTWGSLGGLIDTDQDTYVSAEDSPGSDNDQLKFFTGGTQRGIFSSTGYFGIGTTTPSQLLTVGNNNQFTVDTDGNVSSSGSILVNPAGSSYVSPKTFGFSPGMTSGEAVRLQFGDDANALQTGSDKRMQMYSYWGMEIRGSRETGDAPDFAGTTWGNDPALSVFGGNGDSKPVLQLLNNAGSNAFMTVAGDGKTGIGTTTPTALLSVASSTATGTSNLFSVATSTSIFNVLANGNVGIGTVSPQTALHVAGSSTLAGNVLINIGSSGTAALPFLQLARVNTGFYSRDVGATSLDVSVNGTGLMEFWTAGADTPAVYIPSDRQYGFNSAAIGSGAPDTGLGRLSSGVVKITNGSTGGGNIYVGGNGTNYFASNVGIGTTTPGSLLTVASSTATGTSNLFSVGTTSSILSVLANGGVGVGTSSPIASLAVAGYGIDPFAVASSSGKIMFGVASDNTITLGNNSSHFLTVSSNSIKDYYQNTSDLRGTLSFGGGSGTQIDINPGNSSGAVKVDNGGSALLIGGPASGNTVGSFTIRPTNIGEYGGYSATGRDLLLTGGSASDNGGATARNGGDILLDGGAPINAGLAGNIILGTTRGKVGIGTTTPGSLLSVQGNAYIGGNVTATGTLSVAGQTTLATASSTGLTVTGGTYLATSGGNVGIGTTSPVAKLSVVGNGALIGVLGVGANPTIGNLQIGPVSNTTTHYSQVFATYDSTAGYPQVLYNNQASYFMAQGVSTIGDMVFGSANMNPGSAATWVSQQMVLSQSTGNLGIGSTTPGSRLSVQGNAYIGGNVTATGTLSVAGQTTLATASSTGLTVAGGTYLATTGGNVGIGTASPSQKLEISSGGSVSLLASGPVVSPQFYSSLSNSNDYASFNRQTTFNIYQPGTASGWEFTNNVAADNTSGQVYGIKLLQKYNQTTGTASNTDLLINRAETAVGSGAQYLIDAQVNSVSKFRVTNSGQGYFAGNVGIGTTTPSHKLTVGGDLNFTGSLYQNGTLFSSGISNTYASSTFPSFTYATNTFATILGLTSYPTFSYATSTYVAVTGNQTIAGNKTFTGQMVLGAASSSALTVSGGTYLATSGGNVGIGTTTPTSLLSIASSTATGTSKLFSVGVTSPILEVLADRAVNFSGDLSYTNSGTAQNIINADYNGILNLKIGREVGFEGNANSMNLFAYDNFNFYQTISNGGTRLDYPVMYVNTNSYREMIQGLGRVGIGTSNPVGWLHILTDRATSTPTLVLQATSSQVGSLTQWRDVSNNILSAMGPSGNLAIGTTTSSAKLSVQGAYGGTTPLFDIATTTSAGFATSSLFTVLANGNVGIGTNAPTVPLQINSINGMKIQGVNSNLAITTDVGGYDGRITSQYALGLVASGGPVAVYSTLAGSAAGTTANLQLGRDGLKFGRDSLNTTIGYDTNLDTSAAGSISISGQSMLSTNVTRIAGGNASLFGGNGASGSAGAANGGNVTLDGGVGYGAGHNGYVLLGTTNVGNVGIGTTSPIAMLSVQASSTAQTSPFISFNSTTSPIFNVLANGNVGIGTSTPGKKLTVAGDVLLGNTGTGSLFFDDTNGWISRTAAGNTLSFSPSGNATALSLVAGRLGLGSDINVAGYTGSYYFVGANAASANATSTVWFGASARGGNGGVGHYVVLGGGGGSTAGAGTAGGQVSILGGYAGGSGNNAGGNVYIDGGSATGSGAIGSVLLATNQRGNVGIGTTTPGSLLSVASSTATGTSGLFSIATSTSIFSVLANGNVGIGTSTPTKTLDVEGLSLFKNPTGETSTTKTLDVQNSAGSSIFNVVPGNSMGVQINTNLAINGGNLYLGNGWQNIGSTAGNSSGALVFTTNASSERMRIDGNGNVGIGTMTPTSLLSIASSTATGTSNLFSVATSSSIFNVLANGTINIGTKVSFDATGALISNQNDSSKYIIKDNDGTSYIKSGGKARFGSVGIGADSASNEGVIISFAGNTGAVAYGVRASSSNMGGTAGVGGFYTNRALSSAITYSNAYGLNVDALTLSGGAAVTNNYGVYIANGTSGTNHYGLYQTDAGNNNYFAGNVGIGTTTPDSLLTIASSTATGTSNLFSVGTSSTIFNVLANGNIGIGTSTPGSSLSVSGGASVGSAYAATAFTDGLFAVSNKLRIGSSDFSGSHVLGVSGTAVITNMQATTYNVGGAQFMDGLNTPYTGITIHGRNSSTQASGDLYLVGGTTGAGSGVGARVRLQGGVPTDSNTAGGDIMIDGGLGTGTGAAGNILLGSVRGNVGIGTAAPYSRLAVSSANIPQTWSQVGSGLSISTTGDTAITSLSPNRVAYIDALNDSLRTYEFNGSTWSSVGSGLSITSAGTPALTAISPNRVAFIDVTNDSLRTYEFNGSTWVLVGSGLTISTVGIPTLATLSPNRVAFIDDTNDSLRTYEFNGSTWTQVGSSLSVSTGNDSVLTALSPNRVAFFNTSSLTLSTYEFNGSTWSQVGSALTIVLAVKDLSALSPNRVAFYETTNDTLRTYEFNGSTWSQVGSSFTIATTDDSTLSALSPNRIAFFDNTNDSLRTYQFASPAFAVSDSTDYPFLGVSDAGYVTAEGLAVRTTLNVGQGTAATSSTSTPSFVVSGISSFLSTVTTEGNVGIGTTTPRSKLDIWSATSSSNVDLFRIASSVGSANNIKFRIDSDGDVFTDGGTTIGTPADLAENYPALEAVDAGTVVAFGSSTLAWTQVSDNAPSESYEIAGVRRATDGYSAVGVISTKAGITLGGDTIQGVPVALSGRVPVKVTTEAGVVQAGDYLTVSATRPGYAMKMIGEGKSIGRAISAYIEGRDKVMMIIEAGYQKLDTEGRYATTTGMLTTGNIDLNANGVAIYNIKSLASANGTWSIDENGRITAKVLCLEDVCIDRTQLSNILNSAGQGGAVVSQQSPVDSSTSTSTTNPVVSDQSAVTSTSAGQVAGTSTEAISQTVVENGSPITEPTASVNETESDTSLQEDVQESGTEESVPVEETAVDSAADAATGPSSDISTVPTDTVVVSQ